ncbi:MAG: hypothetical protein DCF25_00825 [Leptolyngbya foveolarum]|uniref:Nuclease n=1 Tax=Leptolyngbya foveolarum TaxID=47253 RepID=A0A2W4WGH5_9CYAN|nr:MAG: hypothetical protein DCF25_00825 [Leptolyngbya foveolarum]
MPVKDKLTDGLKERLENACKDLWWSSEADYPVKVVWQPSVVGDRNPTVINQWISSVHEESKIEKVDLNDFFERATTPKSWHTKDDKVQLSRLKCLKELLNAELSALQVYRCGEVEIAAYVLGYSTEGVLAGVQTVLVET